jgi:hypothetical protein
VRNLLEQAIESDDGDRAAAVIRDAPGIEGDEVMLNCQAMAQSQMMPAVQKAKDAYEGCVETDRSRGYFKSASASARC